MLYSSPLLRILEKLPPDFEVCTEKNKTLRAGELIEKSKNLAAWLEKTGLKRGDHVLLACDAGIEFLVLFLALMHLRTKNAFVDPHMGNQLYAAKVKQFKPQWAFIDSRLLLLQEHPLLRYIYRKSRRNPFYIPFTAAYKIFATGIKLPLFQKNKRLRYDVHPSADFAESKEDDELVLVYTSGTLSEPKAVVHTLNSLYESMIAISSLLKPDEGASLVTHIPHFALIAMMSGYKTCFWKESTSPKDRYAFINKHRITTLFGPPAEYKELINYCHKTGQSLPQSLRLIILGSAPVFKSLLKELRQLTNAKITCLYGMTEHLVVATVDGDEKINFKGQGDLLGQPLKGMEYKINEDGELMIRSPLLFSHYFHLPGTVGFHHTGDLADLDPEGHLVMKGRKKNMIIRANKNIYPALYETTIAQIKGVSDVCMIGIYDESIQDEKVILVIEGAPHLNSKELMQELKSGKYSIDSDALPDHIFFQPIPKSGRQQKVDRLTLNEQVKQKLRSIQK